MIEFEEYKVRLNDLEPKLGELRASLNIDGANEELERLHAMAEAPGRDSRPRPLVGLNRRFSRYRTEKEFT